tara:strand:+ start:120 stop:668 length:549 start_codon:yes stop_codon:yes gene_type:complete
MNFLKHKNKTYVFIFLFFIIYALPCKLLNFLKKSTYFLLFKIMCVGLLIYASQQKTELMVYLTICVFFLYYKVNNMCGLQFRESMFAVLPPISPYNNIPVFVPMDVRNRNMQNSVNYERFFDNVTSDGLMGKYNINQVIPKHHDLRNRDSLDRLLKIESELSNNMSRGEKYYRHKRGFFNMF